MTVEIKFNGVLTVTPLTQHHDAGGESSTEPCQATPKALAFILCRYMFLHIAIPIPP